MPSRLQLALRINEPGRGVWDDLWDARPIGRMAICVVPDKMTVDRVRRDYQFELLDTCRPSGWTPQWQEALEENLANFVASAMMPGDGYPSVHVPRFVHLQSQGMVQTFGAQALPQADGNVFAQPLDLEPQDLGKVKPCRPEESLYWNAVEWVAWARAATGGAVPFRMPIMCGPFDTAGYLLGFSRLMEWCNEEPEALERLLDTITDTIEQFVGALQQAAGGRIDSHHFHCTRGGFDFASESRSLISAAMSERFELSRLRRIGQARGTYGIHSCGSWERTVPASLADPCLRAMNGQVRENDLALLCKLVDGRIALSIGPSVNVHEEFMWASRESFFRYVLETVPPDQPFETQVNESELPMFLALHREVRGIEFELAPPLWNS